MKNYFSVLTVAIIAICCVACSSSSGPEKAAKHAIQALQKKDYDEYAATFNLSASDQKILAGIAEEKVDDAISGKGGIKSYKITDCQVDGDKAVVRVHIVYKDASEETQRMDFVKINNTWKQELVK